MTWKRFCSGCGRPSFETTLLHEERGRTRWCTLCVPFALPRKLPRTKRRSVKATSVAVPAPSAKEATDGR